MECQVSILRPYSRLGLGFMEEVSIFVLKIHLPLQSQMAMFLKFFFSLLKKYENVETTEKFHFTVE